MYCQLFGIGSFLEFKFFLTEQKKGGQVYFKYYYAKLISETSELKNLTTSKSQVVKELETKYGTSDIDTLRDTYFDQAF